MALVKDAYDFDESLLDDLSETSEYWASANKFWLQVKDQEIGTLSDGQRNWLEKIEDGIQKEGSLGEWRSYWKNVDLNA